MSDSKDKQAAPARAGGPGFLGMVLPAILAAGAAFGGVRLAGAHHEAAAASAHVESVKPPGPTLALDPFLLSVADANKKVHPMKVTIAIEFDAKEKEETLKGLTPRIRDSLLGHLRTVSYEETIDPSGGDKIRADMLDRLHTSGVPTAEHVLITDLVIQ
ncbi:MAG TPA: flagellar basal body-associated FliL family protein [Polyangiaceae bacterium]|nr:flagellar basal body-associated FliL family protein [Polyangiaceae bacterium]